MSLFDNKLINRIQTGCRKRRFQIFREIIAGLDKPLNILDIGGTIDFWVKMDYHTIQGINIVIINLYKQESGFSNIKCMIGDGRDMSIFDDESFDIVFSNSVIEHQGLKDDRVRMAEEIKRVGKGYFIQTPNYYFPLEPHYRVPFFQFFPRSIKAFILRNINMGRIKKTDDPEKIHYELDRIYLLKKYELMELFNDCRILKERFFSLTKSFIAYKLPFDR